VISYPLEPDYGKAFRVIRAAFGLRQSELAERLPITASQLSLIEAGKRQPSIRVVDSLAQAVGVPAPLITLLASTPQQLAAHGPADVSDLAKALLRLLVGAAEVPQRELDLSD
jgi:transcriptional regulator with XRE-family HTH domain